MPAILLTRPEPASGRFARDLRARLGEARIVISPLLRVDWLSPALPEGQPIFTSRNGVEGFLRAGGRPGGPCWCVGDATARAAGSAGFDPRSAQGDAAELVRRILASGEAGPFVHLRGKHSRGDVAGTLRRAGLAVAEAVVYDQPAQDPSDEAKALLDGENPVVLPLFSPRSAAQFAKVYDGRAPLFVVAMSAAVKEALDGLDTAATVIAARPDAEAMADAAAGLFDAALQLEAERAGR